MTEPIYIRRGNEYIEAGTIDAAIMAIPEPIPDPPTVAGDAQLRAAIEAWEPGDAAIYVRPGIYSPIDLEGKDGISIEAYGGRALVSGLVPFNGPWTESGNLLVAPYTGFPGRTWHWSKSAGAGDMHRRSACPDLFAIETGEDIEPLRLVHTQEALTPGSYMIALANGDPGRPTHVVLYPPAGTTSEQIRHAPTPYLLRGEGASGVRVHGFDFAYCGNTHKSGAVQVTGQGWDLSVNVQFAAVGISAQGTGHTLTGCGASLCFQLGMYLQGCHDSTFIDCAASMNNTRGANARWEAGGLKGVNSTGNTFRGFTALNNLGPGHWMDISCHRTRVLGYLGRNNAAACVQIEHFMDDGEYQGLDCAGTLPYWLEADRTDELGLEGPEARMKVGSLWMQSNIRRTFIIGARFDNTPLAVKIKEHESRGVVSGCLLDGFEYGPGVVQRKSIERFNDSQIAAAIRAGAKPGTPAEWQAVRNTYGASV